MILSLSIKFCPSRPIRVPQTLLYGTCTVGLDVVGKVQRYMDEKYLPVAFLLVCEKLLIPLPTIFWSRNGIIMEKQMEWCYKRKI